ncbi:MAG: hypothetical protein KAI43_00625 [Candidatus Aureabacteria bacterium]|nr:hypothetical protein [Candidatus Auribacterota bacterium]
MFLTYLMKCKIIEKGFRDNKITLNMKKFSNYILLVLFIFLISGWSSGILYANETPRIIVSDTGGSPITATVYTTGIGKAPDNHYLTDNQKKEMGRRAAVVDGYRNLIATFQGAEQYIVKEGISIFSVEGYLKDVEILETRYFIDGTVEVDMMVLVKVYDDSIVKDNNIIGKLTGKSSPALKGIRILEVDEADEKIKDGDIIISEIKAEDY